MSRTVRLPRAAEPVFPPRCATCPATDALRPSTQTARVERSMTWWQSLLMPAAGKHEMYVAVASACPACHRRLTGRYRRRIAAGLVFVVLLVAGGWWAKARAGWPKWLVGLVGVGVAAALTGLDGWVRPTAFHIRPAGDDLVFEFADSAYAAAFGQLNPRAATEPRH